MLKLWFHVQLLHSTVAHETNADDSSIQYTDSVEATCRFRATVYQVQRRRRCEAIYGLSPRGQHAFGEPSVPKLRRIPGGTPPSKRSYQRLSSTRVEFSLHLSIFGSSVGRGRRTMTDVVGTIGAGASARDLVTHRRPQVVASARRPSNERRSFFHSSHLIRPHFAS